MITQEVFDTYSSIETDAKEEDELNEEDKEMINKIIDKYKGMNIISKKQIDSINTLQSESSNNNNKQIMKKQKGRFFRMSSTSENLTLPHITPLHRNYNKTKPEDNLTPLERMPNLNKSYYLLRNKRLIESVTNLTEITKEDIGGEYSCNCLLKRYYHNIVYTEKMRSKSLMSQPDTYSNTLQSSHKENRRIQVSERNVILIEA